MGSSLPPFMLEEESLNSPTETTVLTNTLEDSSLSKTKEKDADETDENAKLVPSPFDSTKTTASIDSQISKAVEFTTDSSSTQENAKMSSNSGSTELEKENTTTTMNQMNQSSTLCSNSSSDQETTLSPCKSSVSSNN